MADRLPSRLAFLAALTSLGASAVALGTASLASPASDRLDRAVSAAIGPPGSFVTLPERRFIADKCGVAALPDNLHGISIENDRLTCPNGREVRDPAVRALAERIGGRANARAAAVMRDPRVQAAIHGVETEAVARATARRD